MAAAKSSINSACSTAIDGKSGAGGDFYDDNYDDAGCGPVRAIIEGLPKNFNSENLLLYLENRTGKGEISIVEEMENTAVISITDATEEDVPELFESINNTDKLFYGSRLTMQCAPEINCVLATNISAKIDETMLGLFFEKKQLNPNDMMVEVVEYRTDMRAAIIRYDDASALAHVLECNTLFLGEQVNIEICPTLVQARGLSCLNIREESAPAENISSSVEFSAETGSGGHVTENDDKEKVRQSKEDSAGMGARSKTRKHKKSSCTNNTHAATSEENSYECTGYNSSNQRLVNYESQSQQDYESVQGLRKKKFENLQNTGKEDCYRNYVTETLSNENNTMIQGANARGRFPRGKMSQQSVSHQVPSLFAVDTTQSGYRFEAQGARGAAGYHGGRGVGGRRGRGRGGRNNSSWSRANSEADLNISHSVSYQQAVDKQSISRRQGFEGDRQNYGKQFNQRSRASHAARRNSLASNATSDNTVEQHQSRRNILQNAKCSKTLNITNENNNERCELLILMSTDLAKKVGGWMFVDKDSHVVTISGSSDELVDEIQCRILECLSCAFSVRVDSFSDGLLSRLLSNSGSKWLKNVFRLGGQKAVLYRNIDAGYVNLMSISEEEANTALQCLKSAVLVEKILYSKSREEYLKSEQWKKFVEQVEHKSCSGKPGPAGTCKGLDEPVAIAVDFINQFILVEGSQSAAQCAKNLIVAEFANNETNTYEFKLDNAGKVRLLKLRLEVLRETGVTISIDEGSVALRLSGLSDNLVKAQKEVERLIKQMTSQTLNICRAGITRTQFLTKGSMLQLHVHNLEHSNECVITAEEVCEKFAKSPTTQEPVLTVSASKMSLNGSLSKATNLQVIKGDITMHTADVLVNPLCNDTNDLKRAGTVSAAFVKAGGSDLEKSFKEASPDEIKSTGIITPACGNLSASKIFHIRLTKYLTDDPGKAIEKMQKGIDWCMKTAVQLNMRSITFPTLGCGLLRYPVDVIANCFKLAATQTPQIVVTVIAWDDETFQGFSSSFNQDPAESLDLSKYLKQKTFERSSLKFIIHAYSMNVCIKVKNDLEEIIENCLSKSFLSYDTLGSSDVKNFLSHQSADVNIDIDDIKKRICIEGAKKEVEEVNDKLSKLLDAVYKRSVKSAELKARTSVVQQMRSLQVDSTKKTHGGLLVPSYWANYKGDISSLSSESKVILTPIPASHSIYVSLNKIINDTWDTTNIGLGHDAVGLQHSRIQVKSINLIENVMLYKKYQRNKEDKGGPALTSIGSLSGQEVATITAADETLKAMFDKRLNECFLFHGTNLDKKDGIIHSGLDGRLGSQRALFGQGIYFAESSTKADQYSDGRQARTAMGTTLYMFIARVLLGRAYICQAPLPYKRPPCSNSSCYSDTCTVASHLPLHDSVVGTHNFTAGGSGTRKLLFREFVLYDASLCYPEFLIEYIRI